MRMIFVAAAISFATPVFAGSADHDDIRAALVVREAAQICAIDGVEERIVRFMGERLSKPANLPFVVDSIVEISKTLSRIEDDDKAFLCQVITEAVASMPQ